MEIHKAVDQTLAKYDTDKNGFLDTEELIPMLQDATNYLGKQYKID